MNILVIGNGFDLAHELPTKYTDFLFFCSVVKKIIKDNKIEANIPYDMENYNKWLGDGETLSFKEIDKNIYIVNFRPKDYKIRERDKKVYNEIIVNYIRPIFFKGDKDVKLIKKIIYLIHDNFWIDYFLQCDMHGEENWIDFESEISKVIRSLDNDVLGLSDYGSIDDVIMNLSNNFLQDKYFNYTSTVRSINVLTNGTSEKITFKEIRNRLLTDLNKLIMAFEIYLTEYVEKIEIQKKSLNIERVEVDHVLSFNYTNTYEKIYANTQEIKYDYIHGKAELNNDMEFNNMVLGIDEYLPKKRRNKDVEFIAFKKYYQRILKQTGCKYKIWVDKIKQDYTQYLKRQEEADRREYTYIPDSMQRMMNHLATSAIKEEEYSIHNLYIFGHSLDVTDKDILRDLILNDNVHTTIFYLNKDVMGQQIANLVKVIGQKELIRRTGGSTPTIKFKQQQKLIPINQ